MLNHFLLKKYISVQLNYIFQEGKGNCSKNLLILHGLLG